MRVLGLLLILVSQPLLAQTKALIPGTTVELAVPVGFELADGFAGLAHPASGSSVQVVQLRGEALDAIRVVLTPDSLLRQGYSAATLRDTTLGGAAALWSEGRQRQGDRHFEKRSLAMQLSDGVVVLSTSVPTDESAVLRSVEALLLDYRPESAAPADLFLDLPFSAVLPDGLRDVQRMNQSVIARTERTAPSRARFSMGTERGPTASGPTSLLELARDRHRLSLGQTLVSDPPELREILVGGRRGVEVVSDGASQALGSARMLYLALFPTETPGFYVVVQGLAGGDAPRDWLPPFRRATNSVRWAE